MFSRDPGPFHLADPKELDDEELLLAVYDRGADPAKAEAALTAIVAKHSGFLESVCRKRGWSSGEYFVKDLLTDAFTLLYHHQPSFRPPKDATTPLAVGRAFRAWLCAICHKLFLKHLAELRTARLLVPAVSEIDLELDPNLHVLHPVLECRDEPGILPKERALILRFLDSLPDDDRFILVESAPYWDPKLDRFDLKQTDARLIAAALGKKTNTVTKQRGRLMGRLKTYLEENLQETKT